MAQRGGEAELPLCRVQSEAPLQRLPCGIVSPRYPPPGRTIVGVRRQETLARWWGHLKFCTSGVIPARAEVGASVWKVSEFSWRYWMASAGAPLSPWWRRSQCQPWRWEEVVLRIHLVLDLGILATVKRKPHVWRVKSLSQGMQAWLICPQQLLQCVCLCLCVWACLHLFLCVYMFLHAYAHLSFCVPMCLCI